MPPRNQAPGEAHSAHTQNAGPPVRHDLPVSSHQLSGCYTSVHHPGRPRRRRLLRSLLAAPTLIATVTALSVIAAGAGSASAATLHGGHSPRAALIDSELNAVGMTSGGSAWAVGQYLAGSVEAALTEQWPGSWQQQPVPQAGGPTANDILNGVAVLSPTNAWAVGTSFPWPPYDTLIEHWNGAEWHQVASPNPGGLSGINRLYGVAALSASNIWAVGAYMSGPTTSKALIVHWDGTTWKQVPSPEPAQATSAALNDVAVLSPTDAWAVGSYDNGTANQSLTEHWNGTAWQIVPSPDPAGTANWASLNGVAMLTHTNVWAAGEIQTQGVFHTFVAHWNGATWKHVTSVDPGGLGNNAFLRSIAAVSGSRIWAVGSYNNGTLDQTLIEQWNGQAWKQVPSPSPGTGPLNNELFGVSANSPSNAWAVGWYNVGPVNQTLILHWNGIKWTQVYSPNG